MGSDITVVIPTIPPRAAMLSRAVRSVDAQTLRPEFLRVEADVDREGAAATRQRGLEQVTTGWTAFLDDDDELMPEHLEHLRWYAKLTAADYVFSYFMVKDVLGREQPDVDPLGHLGRPFDPSHPHQTTITILVRTELAQQVGFREPPKGELIDGQPLGEDFVFTRECAAAGANIVHLPRRTWWWHHHGANTSGRPDRW